MSVALRVVVAGIDDDLAGQRGGRNKTVVLQRDCDDDDVSGLRSLGRSCWSCFGASLFNERCQSLGATRVADHNVVIRGHRDARQLTSDITGANQSNSLHGVFTPGCLRLMAVAI